MSDSVLQKPRFYQYDTIKALLAFEVIFGHLLQPFLGVSLLSCITYLFIYPYHMPLFMYILGKFAKRNDRRCAMYLLVYALTISFNLWFLLAASVYLLTVDRLLPKTMPAKHVFLSIGINIVLAILAGFVPFIGTYASASRIICMYPFFIMGRYSLLEFNFKKRAKLYNFLMGCSAICLTIIYIVTTKCSYKAFWLDNCYEQRGTTWIIRVFVYFLAAIWIMFILNAMPKFKVPVLSEFGKYSLFSYIAHTFLLPYIWAMLTPCYRFSYALILSFMLWLLFSSLALLYNKARKKKGV